MSKIIAFFTSPRKNGYTAKLINRVLDGAKSADAEVSAYYLNDDGIRGCQGCFYCRGHETCATKDKFHPFYEEIKEADGIVAGFPIYFGEVGGQGKILLDRLYPMLDVNFAPRYPGKKVVTVYAQANPDPSLFTGAADKTHDYFKLCGWNLINSFLIYGDVAEGYTIPDELLAQAFEAGKQLVC